MLGCPSEDCAENVVKAIASFVNDRGNSSVKSVYLVVKPDDQLNVTAFEEELSRHTQLKGRSAPEDEPFMKCQSVSEELTTPSTSGAVKSNRKWSSDQPSWSSGMKSENQKTSKRNSDPESLLSPAPGGKAIDLDELLTSSASEVANSNYSPFLGKQSEAKSQNQKRRPSAQQKETSSQERQLHQRKTGTSWELSAVRSAPSESAKGIRSSDRGSSPAAGVPSGKPKSGDKEEDSCAICIGSITNRKALPCGHAFCSPCIDQWFKQKPSCPNCFKTFGKVTGNQPAGGTMHHSTRSSSLPGFRDCGTIEINYHIPSGRQTDKHPNPGQPYGGTSRTAYLPDNTEGRKVLGLLKKAFDARLTFTVGTSRTTGAQNQVTWNDIHHKTSAHGGAFGYPDKTYLERVMGELKDKGIE
eukprot:m.178428 g.178428  ORF g.178428 m.178428 type:complete len:413 (+) comp39174_c0_seq1:3066-4304(+)